MKLTNLNDLLMTPDGVPGQVTIKAALVAVMANTQQGSVDDAQKAVAIKRTLLESSGEMPLPAEDYVFLKKTLERAVSSYIPDVWVQLYEYLQNADHEIGGGKAGKR